MHIEEIRHYRIAEVLGKGGFGTVYRADRLGVDGFVRPIALKILNPGHEDRSEVAVRLRDEARMLGLLRHRAIVQVDGLVRLRGRWAIVMEYVDGVDLREVINEGPVPVGVALEIAQEVAAALYIAHDHAGPDGQPMRLLHRDIKPANVRITSAGEVKVLDFGVARAEFDTREAVTQRLFFGSIPYLSPERLEFVDTHAGDVYALGVLMFEMLSGTMFGETSVDDVEHARKVERACARLRRSDVPKDVIGLVRDALAYAPEHRPTAREFERRARLLRQRLPEPWLSDWAEQRVARILEARSRLQDDLCGLVLQEDSSKQRRKKADPTPMPWWLALGGVATGATLAWLLFG